MLEFRSSSLFGLHYKSGDIGWCNEFNRLWSGLSIRISPLVLAVDNQAFRLLNFNVCVESIVFFSVLTRPALCKQFFSLQDLSALHSVATG